MSKPLRLIIDMDDVMADTSQSILDLYFEYFGVKIAKSELLGTLRWNEELQEQYLTFRHRLFEPGFFRNVAVLPGAVEIIPQLQEKYEVFIVSAATEFPNSLKEKHEWLEQYFPSIHWKNLVLCGDKSIVSGDIMIDDHEKNLVTFNGRTLLFDAMHNQALKGYERVRNWKEIAELLL